MTAVRTVVLGDVRMHREGLAALLGRESEIEIVDACPDVVVIDVPGLAGPLPRVDGVAVLAVGVREDEGAILACVEGGADAYTTCDAGPADVAAAVVRLARGEVVCPQWMLRRLAARAAPTARTDDLTQREREVLGLVGEGLSNKQIARRLGIELSTVKNHVHNILEKLGVNRRGEAVLSLRTARV